MAAISNTPFHLAVTEDSIYIGDFWVPFVKSDHFTVREDSKVEVCFDGAMGLSEPTVIEFHLRSAEKVAEFTQALLRNTGAKPIADSPRSRPHYTISPTAMSKLESQESFEEHADADWHHIHFLYSELSRKFPKIKAASHFFLGTYQYLDRHAQLGFPYHVEILKNAYRSLLKLPLAPEESRAFLELGGGRNRRYPRRNRTDES